MVENAYCDYTMEFGTTLVRVDFEQTASHGPRKFTARLGVENHDGLKTWTGNGRTKNSALRMISRVYGDDIQSAAGIQVELLD